VRAAYGIDVQSPEDQYIVLGEKTLHDISTAMNPSYSLYNAFPILKYIPTWLLGAELQSLSRNARDVDRMVKVPLEDVKAKITAGTAAPSLVSAALKSGNYSEEDIKWAAGSLYIAGADSTYISITTLLFAMVKFPEIQKKAQAEIDRIVGRGRLPTFADRAELPYIDCVIKETLRWKIISPLGVPHHLLEDDYYNGYWIPRGSTILPNVWAIGRDKTLYKNPDRFWPERFEGEAGEAALDPYTYLFGFGRRICPGLHFVDSMIFIVFTSILATLDISKPLGQDGQEVEPNENYGRGIMNNIHPFECTIKPRSMSARALIGGNSA